MATATTQKRQPVNGKQKKSDTEDPLVNLSEVARQMGRTHHTIKRWIVQDRILPAVILPNGLLVVRQSDISKFVGGTAIEK